MAKNRTVCEGQRYVQRPGMRNWRAIWKVGAIKAGDVPIPHARLVNVTDPLCSKTISCITLADPAFYELLSDAAGPTSPT